MYKVYQIRHSIPGKETISNIIVTNEMETLFTCYLMELPWEFNKSRISCIPVDTYTLKKREPGENGSRFDYAHFEVLNVPGRSGIKWHIMNYARQSNGCGGPGMNLADIDKDGLMDVTSSTKALKSLLDILPDESELIILNG